MANHPESALKTKYDNFVVNDAIVSCHYDNLWCRQWRQSCLTDDLFFQCAVIVVRLLSQYDITITTQDYRGRVPEKNAGGLGITSYREFAYALATIERTDPHIYSICDRRNSPTRV